MTCTKRWLSFPPQPGLVPDPDVSKSWLELPGDEHEAGRGPSFLSVSSVLRAQVMAFDMRDRLSILRQNAAVS